jgi:hypothetical protein
MAESLLQNTVYHGEKKRWNLEKYIAVHAEQHGILTSLIPYGHAGIDDRSKVRHFLNGVKTMQFEPVRLRIMADDLLAHDFTRVTGLYQDYLKGLASYSPPHQELNISGASTGGGKGDDDDVEDRYYTNEEYLEMGDGKKENL